MTTLTEAVAAFLDKRTAIIRIPGWGFGYCEARYYGWRHSLHIGPWLVFWGLMSEAEMIADDDLDRAAEARDG